MKTIYRTLANRMSGLERAQWARRTPIERAYDLIAQGAPPNEWPNAELEAYCATLPPEILALSNAELEAIVAQEL